MRIPNPLENLSISVTSSYRRVISFSNNRNKVSITLPDVILSYYSHHSKSTQTPTAFIRITDFESRRFPDLLRHWPSRQGARIQSFHCGQASFLSLYYKTDAKLTLIWLTLSVPFWAMRYPLLSRKLPAVQDAFEPMGEIYLYGIMNGEPVLGPATLASEVPLYA